MRERTTDELDEIFGGHWEPHAFRGYYDKCCEHCGKPKDAHTWVNKPKCGIAERTGNWLCPECRTLNGSQVPRCVGILASEPHTPVVRPKPFTTPETEGD